MPSVTDSTALVSVHDLMPETFDAVLGIVRELAKLDAGPATLLVVPGRDWSGPQIDTLKALAEDGHPLAGHGWTHQVAQIRGLKHWLHSQLLSRNVAEHLALTEPEIAYLIEQCYAWFDDVGLPAPSLYVPPAWAMGAVSRARLRLLPFHRYETLTGIYDAREDRFHRIPLLGYEADTALRAAALRLSNQLNRVLARGRALRIAIHPLDLRLRLADDIFRDLEAIASSAISKGAQSRGSLVD